MCILRRTQKKGERQEQKGHEEGERDGDGEIRWMTNEPCERLSTADSTVAL